MTKFRRIISRLLPFFGVALFVFILSRIGLSNVLANFKGLGWAYFAVAVLAMVPAIMLKAQKWRIVLKSLGVQLAFWESFRIILVSYFVGSLTPARLGDFSRALYLKREDKTELVKGFSSTLIDRIFDLGLLIILAFFSILFLVNFYSFAYSSIATIIAIAFAFVSGIVVLLRKNFVRKLMRPFFYMLTPEKYQGSLRNAFDSFYSHLSAFIQDKKSVLCLAVYTILTWLASFASVYFGALALHIPVTYLHMLLIIPFTTLVETLPISFSGIGTRDVVLISMFTLFSMPSSMAVSFSVMILALNYILNLFGVVFWVKKPFKI